MVIDIILDRKDGYGYIGARQFYDYCTDSFACYEPIARAFDMGDEPDVRQALKDYCIEQQYDIHNGEICKYIDSVNWL